MFARSSALSNSILAASTQHASALANVVICERHPIAVLQVSAFAATITETQRILCSTLGLAAPAANQLSGDSTLSLRFIAPGVWQIVGDVSLSPQAAALRATLQSIATVVDVSHGRSALLISGPSAAKSLAKFCGLDLAPDKFMTGHSTQTRFGHIAMTLSRLDDVPTFETLVYRGYAQHVFESLVDGAAEFGLRIEQ
jgi:sarcosine oxidase subunit gamma